MATYGTFVDGVTLTAAEANDFLVWTSFTPVVRQPGSLAITNSAGRYAKINKFVIVYVAFSGSGTGTANTRLEVDMPITAAASNARVIGSGTIWDTSASDNVRFAVTQFSTTRFAFISDTTTSLSTYIGQTGGPEITFTSGGAIGDFLTFTAMYEAA